MLRIPVYQKAIVWLEAIIYNTQIQQIKHILTICKEL